MECYSGLAGKENGMKRYSKVIYILCIWIMTICLFMTGYSYADTLIIPSSSTMIESEAFYGDREINNIILPELLKRIEARAFAKTSVEEIYLPSSLQYIADNAFEDTPLRRAYAQEGTYSHQWAVNNGYLPTFTITANMETMDAAGGELTLMVEFDGPWSVEVEDDWLSIDGNSFMIAENNESLHIQVLMNSQQEQRTSTIRFFGDGEVAEYSLKQAAYVPATEISLDESLVKLSIGSRKILLPSFQPANATNHQLVWASDNESVATVNENGAVDAVEVGLANITATAENGSVSAVCQVCVLPEYGELEDVPLVASLYDTTSICYSWEEVPYATGYELTRTGSDGSTRSIIYLVREESYIDTDLTPGVTYTYAINAYHFYTQQYSLYSNITSISLSVPLSLEGKNYNIINAADTTAYINAFPPTQNAPWTALVATSKGDNSAEQMWALEAVQGTTDCYRLKVMEFNGLYINATTSGATIGNGGTIFRVVPNGNNYLFKTLDGNYALGLTDTAVHQNYQYQKYIKLLSFNVANTKLHWKLQIKNASLTVNVSSVAMDVGDTATITAYITSDGSGNVPPLLFTSSNTTVATVDNAGVITAKKAGITTIHVCTVTGISKDVSVTVSAASVTAPTEGPVCQVSVNGRNVTISWTAIAEAAWYDIELYDEAAWNLHQTSPAPNQWTQKYVQITDTSYTLALADGNYHVGVAAVNSAGYKYGTAISFTVDTTLALIGAPDAFVQVMDDDVTVTWSSVTGAEEYLVSIYYKADWDANEKDRPIYRRIFPSSGNQWWSLQDLEVCDYVVSVTAMNADCERTGASASFTIGNPVRTAPMITTEVNGKALGVTWTAIENAQSYLVEVYNMNDWNNGMPICATKTHSESALLSLRTHVFILDDDYYWVSVTAINGASRMTSFSSRIIVGEVGPIVQFQYTALPENENVCFSALVTAEGNSGTLKVNLEVSNKYYDIVNTKFTSPNETLHDLAKSGIIYNPELLCGSVFNVESSKPNSNDRVFFLKGGSTRLLFGGYYSPAKENRTVILTIKPSTDGSYRVGTNNTLTITLKDVDALKPTDKKNYRQDEWALQCMKWFAIKYPSGYRWNHYLGTLNDQNNISKPDFGCSTDFHYVSANGGTISRFNTMLETGHVYEMGERVCNGNKNENSATCVGFARFIAYEIFGVSPGNKWTATTYSSYANFEKSNDKFHPGDYVATSNHACIIASSDGTQMLHCNHSWGGVRYRCRISRTNDGIWTWTTKQWLEYENKPFTVYHYNSWEGKK